MTILKKLDYFVKKGYSKQAIKLITVKVPSVFNYSREGLDEKIGILKEHNSRLSFKYSDDATEAIAHQLPLQKQS